MRTASRPSITAVLCIWGIMPLSAQLHLPGKKPKEEAIIDTKNQRGYEKLKAYSQNKYENDVDFKDEVDESFHETMRGHSERAYDRNTHRTSKVVEVHEDRFRQHSALYDNLLVQDHINQIGQRLVPADSDHLFAFRLIPDPIPSAETLATGTIYISTGMVSLLDSEAQLAYILAHEMAHVQLDHWKERVMLARGQEEYARDQQKKNERIALLAGLASGLTMGLVKDSAAVGLLAGAAGAGIALEVASLLNRPIIVAWDKVQEDDADKMAFKAMLEAKYDVREVPKLYVALEGAVTRDQRAALGFLGDRKRVKQRKEQADRLIAEAYKAEIEAKLSSGAFLGDSADHRNLMGELKRDNGIMAFYHDMFEMARNNLSEAVAIRENDPTSQYYYGKVLKLVGRTDEDRKLAVNSFLKATQYDKHMDDFGSHLHYALSMIQAKNTADQQAIVNELDTYVTDYIQSISESEKNQVLPPNLDTIYKYMTLYGNVSWEPKMPAGFVAVRMDPKTLVTNPELLKTPIEKPVAPVPDLKPKTLPIKSPLKKPL